HRLGATLVDDVVAFIIALPGIILLFATSSTRVVLLDNGNIGSEPSFKPVGLFGILIFGLLAVLYVPVMLSMKGYTFGNMALGTLVVDAATGAQLRPGQAWGRTAITWLISTVTSFMFGLGSLLDDLWCLWDPNGQTLHDKAAKTLVVKKQA
ncbi:MAG: RDD family protein, partial [Actinomycetota bacterium]